MTAHRIHAINDAARSRLFVAATVGIVTVAVALTLTAPDRDAPPAVAPPQTVPEQAGRVPSHPARTVVATTARRFVVGYLAFLYGRAGTSAIASSTPEVVHKLARARVRVPAGARGRVPKLVNVRTDRLDGTRWLVSVVVRDRGVSVFPIELIVSRLGTRFAVTRVLDE